MIQDKYVIINFHTMEYMKDSNGNIKYYNTEEEARLVCGIYEFEDVWVCKLMFNHKEQD